jgi:lipopolysaccharide transport system ATP-binding protein
VGDAQFQKKCLGKMGEVSRGGRTVLFVSHNLVAVQSLCRRAVLLKNGQLEFEGSAAAVVSRYLRNMERRNEPVAWPTPDEAPGNDALRVKQVSITPCEQRVDGLIGMNSPIQVETQFWVLKPELNLHITYHLMNEQEIVVLTTASQVERRTAGLFRTCFTLPGDLLNSGGYTLKLLIVQNENSVIYNHPGLASFDVVDSAERLSACLGREPGIVQPTLRWTETPVSPLEPAAIGSMNANARQ